MFPAFVFCASESQKTRQNSVHVKIIRMHFAIKLLNATFMWLQSIQILLAMVELQLQMILPC